MTPCRSHRECLSRHFSGMHTYLSRARKTDTPTARAPGTFDSRTNHWAAGLSELERFRLPTVMLDGNDAAATRRAFDVLVFGELEPPRDGTASIARVDDVIDEPPAPHLVNVDARFDLPNELASCIVGRLLVAEQLLR